MNITPIDYDQAPADARQAAELACGLVCAELGIPGASVRFCRAARPVTELDDDGAILIRVTRNPIEILWGVGFQLRRMWVREHHTAETATQSGIWARAFIERMVLTP
jgi:hypothetical protein